MIRVKYWLWLVMVFGVSNVRLWKVMECFDDPIIAYEKLCRDEHDLNLNKSEIANISKFSIEHCESIIKIYQSKGVGIVGFSSREYPQYLRHIYNPPAILFYQGNIDILNRQPAITMVGTRRATRQSLMTAERLSKDLATNGFIIVSGFATGIDISSTLAVSNMGMPTVSVLGCGIDVDYPKENSIYRDRVLKNNGVFLTEYFFGTPAYSQNFPRRNRILSGVSRAVVIVEASIKSGSLITAEHALEQGREVFFVPPANIYDVRYAGNIKFLREGANPVYGYEDIADYFDLLECQISLCDDEVIETPINQEKNENIEKKVPKVNENKNVELTEIQNKIVEILKNGKTHVDIISSEVEINMSELTIELTNLELDGIVESFSGNFYGLK